METGDKIVASIGGLCLGGIIFMAGLITGGIIQNNISADYMLETGKCPYEIVEQTKKSCENHQVGELKSKGDKK